MIARVRKRPRVRSISLRTFGWLCRIEAQATIEAGHGAFDPRSFNRRRFLGLTSRQRAAMIRDVLRRYPERRVKP